MTETRLNKTIIGLTLPAILSNITVPVLGLCDTGIAGHLGSSEYIDGIAIGAMMLNVLFWLCGFLRMGTTGLTAQEYGAGNEEGVRRVFTRSFMLAALLGIIILIFSYPIEKLFSLLMSPEENVAGYVDTYFFCCVFGLPAQLATMSILGWLLGMQNTVRPMIISISTNIVNIVLSFSFVFGIGMGFKGVALGTMFANWCGLLLALILVYTFRKGKRIWATLEEIKGGGSLRRYFSVNSDLFFRSACVMGVSLTVTAIGSRLGGITLATNAILMQFFILFSYFMDGFAFTGEALCGRFAGAGDIKMLKKSIRYLLAWAAAMALVFFTIYALGNSFIINMLTDNEEVRANCLRHKIWIIILPPVTVAAFIYDGFFIGLTATRRMLIVTIISASIFFITLFIRFNHGIYIGFPDNATLWTAFLSYLLFRGLLLAIQMPTLLKHPLGTTSLNQN